MGLEIFWSQFAEDKLYDIFQYYKLKLELKLRKKSLMKLLIKL